MNIAREGYRKSAVARELTCIEEESSILAFSAASLTLCSAILSVETSIPCCVGERGAK